MTDGMYLEVLAAFGNGSDVRCHVVRGLSPRSLAELGCELFDAETNGDDLDDILTSWSVVFE